jgi:outer membrane protein W
MKRGVLATALVAAAMLPGAASAQGGPGFLFSEPRVTLSFRGGYSVPSSRSGIFAFPLDSLTINNFNAPYVGGALSLRASDHVDVDVDLGWTGVRRRSEYVNWVDQNNLPIQQTTTFQTVATTLGAKYYFGDRGRSIGRFVWVPAKLTPFVRAGVGLVWYEFKQSGDFVDFLSPTYDVFSDYLRTSATSAVAQLGGGANLSLSRQLFLTGEARYSLASARVNAPFDTSENIDLNGLQMMLGIGLRF